MKKSFVLKTEIETHLFWKFGYKGKYCIFHESVDVLYSRIQEILKWIPVLFLGLQFVHLFNVSDFSNAFMVKPLWPMLPFKNVPTTVLVLVFQINMFIAFSSLCFKGELFLLKLYAFITYFLYVAFANSFGKIDHVLHLPLMVLFCYLLIPSQKIKEYKVKTILVFASVQFFLLFSYTLTGLWKLFWGVVQWLRGEISIFSPLSFRNNLVYIFQIKEPTLIGEWLIDHYYLGWLAFWIVIYLEVCSVFVFFKGNLHKVWGVLLILLHFGIALIMDIIMFTAPLAIGVLLIMSPFNKTSDFKSTVLSLPVVAEIGSLIKR